MHSRMLGTSNINNRISVKHRGCAYDSTNVPRDDVVQRESTVMVRPAVATAVVVWHQWHEGDPLNINMTSPR